MGKSVVKNECDPFAVSSSARIKKKLLKCRTSRATMKKRAVAIRADSFEELKENRPVPLNHAHTLFKAGFDESLKAVFKKERQKRKSTLVEIKTENGLDYFGVSPQNGQVALEGTYAYVTLSTEKGSIIQAWPKSADKHNDTAHFALSKYAAEVLYAGEATFTPLKVLAASRCKEFNNASGCYKPDQKYKHQAGLPIDKFVEPNFVF